MKRHRRASTVSIGTRNESDSVGSVGKQTHAAFDENTRSEPGVVLASVNGWTHTLVLTGELNHRSAHALEAEIDRLCEEGVTGITLDLRGLTYIDSIGLAVIAFRCGLLRRRGYDLALIPGSRFIHRAFERAGIAHSLPFEEDDVASSLAPALALGHRSRDGCEQ